MRRNIFWLLLFLLGFGGFDAARAFEKKTFPFPDLAAGAQLETRSELSADLEEQALQLYELGQFDSALQVLQQAIARYEIQGDRVGQATALRNVALVYLKLGKLEPAKASLTESLNWVRQLEESQESLQIFAQILEVQGQLQLSSGQPELARETWQQAREKYATAGDLLGTTRSQMNQVQAMRSMGLYNQASKQLQGLGQSLEGQPDSLLKVQALQNLGEVLLAVGRLEDGEQGRNKGAKTVLRESLTIAKRLQDREAIASVLISLGKTAGFELQQNGNRGARQAALSAYEQAIAASPSPEIESEARLNLFGLLVQQKDFERAIALVPKIQANLQQLPPNPTAIYARINFARNLMQLKGQDAASGPSSAEIARDLAGALQDARNLGDRRTEAYALGSLGKLYEQNQRWEDAQTATEQALLVAQSIRATDLAYQWQWQLGRVLCRGKGSCPPANRESAIAAYSQAVKSLKSLRSDLAAISTDVQFSFRDSVEPVYREFASILLSPSASGQASQENIKQARDAIEALQLAELDNFFRDACLDARGVPIDQLDPEAAVFYSIILRDRLETIVALPGQPLRHYATPLSEREIEENLTEMRKFLLSPRLRAFHKKRLAHSKKLYDWLIGPIDGELQASGIKTLVFVADGLLRSIPIATLHDGEQYVVEKYSVATAPTLNLADPRPLSQKSLQVLSAGLTEARQGFNALPNVQYEIDRIQAEVPAEVLLDRSFTEDNFKAQVSASSFPIVHLATHGEFSSNAEGTYLLTWDSKLDIEELNSLLRADSKQTQPIELLVLSACKTAAGDKRAALGLAGVAVRAGARSTLASLWYVSDEATSVLMTRFYEELSGGNISRAEALRRAQVAVLQEEKFAHPYYWSAFVLVGNWL